jgi:hypothetical protein
MNFTGRHCPVTNNIDLDAEIHNAVEATEKLAKEIIKLTDTKYQSNAIFKAMINTLVESIK